MAKKRLIHRIPRAIKSEKEDSDVGLLVDLDAIATPIQKRTIASEDEIAIKKLYITPAGYPIKPFDAPDSSYISINSDSLLFQAYALEQWLGLSVAVGDYMFDQLLLPDYAFKVMKVAPKTAQRISSDTKIIIQQETIPKPTFSHVRFEDVIGNIAAKEKAQIIVEYLKEPKKFGVWGPKNILFHGPPGTGKTLMARAIATAAGNCNFLAKKGTMLIGLHVGDGASKIHTLFQEAREQAPTIIFIDELDSIGLNRSYQNVRGDVIEVATALLAELDGLEPNEGVITIGATNSIDLLDLGLRNRFEEEIEFPIPTEAEREAMLRLFAQSSPIPIRADFSRIAKMTDQWSGRSLHEKLMKVAIHQALRRKLPEITQEILINIVIQLNKQQNPSKPPSNFFS